MLNLSIHYTASLLQCCWIKLHVYSSAQFASRQQWTITATSHQLHDSDTQSTWIHFNLGSKALWQPLSSTQSPTCLGRLWSISTLAVTQDTRANQYRTAGCVEAVLYVSWQPGRMRENWTEAPEQKRPGWCVWNQEFIQKWKTFFFFFSHIAYKENVFSFNEGCQDFDSMGFQFRSSKP